MIEADMTIDFSCVTVAFRGRFGIVYVAHLSQLSSSKNILAEANSPYFERVA